MIPNPYQAKPDPESIILDILSRKPGLTSKEVFEFFGAKYPKHMTLQGFYKILRQLLADRVIVKSGGKLSLYSAWVKGLVAFAEQAKETYLTDKASRATILLEEGEGKTFTFERPDEMDTFWDHALLTVAFYYQDYGGNTDLNAYSKNFYSWIQLLRTSGSTELSHQYEGLDMEWYMASGSHSFLNRVVVPNQHTASNFHFVTYDALIGYGEGQDNFHVTVLGDFVFETKLPNFIFEIVKRTFESVENLAEFKIEPLQALIHENARTELLVSRNAKRAEKIRSEIRALFAL